MRLIGFRRSYERMTNAFHRMIAGWILTGRPASRDSTPVPIVVSPPGPPLFVEGEGVPDAARGCVPQRPPLIVVSHGTGGTAMALSWLCAGLATHAISANAFARASSPSRPSIGGR